MGSEWRTTSTRHTQAEGLFVGALKRPLVEVRWSCLTKEDRGAPWVVDFSLPGLKVKAVRHSTMDEAKTVAEAAIKRWFDLAKGAPQ